MNIGITGSDGLLGWHQRAFFKAAGSNSAITLANRKTFEDPAALAAFTSKLDAVIHYAGMNRGDEAEIESTNIALAKNLAAACEQSGAKPFIVYANTTHHERDTAYGRGKREAANLFKTWANKRSAGFANAVLPHVFGEFGKPFYNSVVSTFCHQLAKGETPQVVADGDLELVHTQEVAAFCTKLLTEKHSGDARLAGAPMKVSSLLARLVALHQRYLSGILPALPTLLDAHLFNTLRSYMFPAHYPIAASLRSDARGHLFEAIKSDGGGQVFFSTTHPGVTRGNHFHTRKVERFLVTEGEAEIRMRKLFSDKIIRFNVRGDVPSAIDIPTFYTHDITNKGASELTTLFWSNEIFDPSNPDTIAEPVGTV